MSNQVSLSVFTLNVQLEPRISNEAIFILELRKLYHVSGQLCEIDLITKWHDAAQTRKAALQSKSLKDIT